MSANVCSVCETRGEERLYTCSQCSISVHLKCYGYKKRSTANDYLCDVCIDNDPGSKKSNEIRIISDEGMHLKKENAVCALLRQTI